MRRQEEAAWEDEGGALLPRRAWVARREYFDRMYESILHMDFSVIEKRWLAWLGSPPCGDYYARGGVVTGRWGGRVGDYERYQMPGLRPNETPAILKAADDRIARYPKREVEPVNITINVGDVSPEAMESVSDYIRSMRHKSLYGGSMCDYQRQSLAAMQDYCASDVQLEQALSKGTLSAAELHDSMGKPWRARWARVTAWVKDHWPW